MNDGVHPGATGLLREPIVRNLSSIERIKVNNWLDSWNLERRDDAAFIAAIEQHVRTYLHIKAVAERSSAAAVKKNLRAAELAAGRLLLRLQDLDGNSSQLLALQPAGSEAWQWAIQIHSALQDAGKVAERKYRVRGARPKDERIQFAAQLRHALLAYTSAKISTAKGQLFEDLLRLGFELIGEPPRTDLHTLAEQASRDEMQIEVTGGVTYIPRPKRKMRHS